MPGVTTAGELRSLLSQAAVARVADGLSQSADTQGVLALAEAHQYRELVAPLAELGRSCTLAGLRLPGARILVLLANALKMVGDWQRAEATYSALVEHSSADVLRYERAMAHLGLAEILGYRGDYEDSIRHASSAYVLATHENDRALECLISCFQAGIHSRTGDQPRGRELLERAVSLVAQVEGERTAYLWSEIERTQGLFSFRDGDMATAEEKFAAAAGRLSHAHYPVECGEALRYLGVVKGTRGRDKESLETHRDALVLFRRADCLFGQARTFNSIGRTFLQLTRLEEALFYMEKGVRMCRDLGADAELATICGKIGNAYMLAEDYGRAITYLQQDLELSKRFRNYYALAYTHRNLGRCYTRGGNLEEGINYLKDSLSLFQFVNDGANLGRVLLDLCQADAERGKLHDARNLGGKALIQLINHKQFSEVAFAHVVLGAVERRLGHLTESAEHLTEAFAGLEPHGFSSRLAEAHYEQGLLDADRGQPEPAFSHLGMALTIAKELGLKKHAARCYAAMEGIGEIELLAHLTSSVGTRRAHSRGSKDAE